MDVDWVRRFCLSLPHTTESVQWGNHLVLKIGGKIYAIVALEPSKHFMSLKCTPEDFAELIEQPGIEPAPYLARSHWVALESGDTLPRTETKKFLRKAYDLVFAKLPKKMRAELSQ
jgi:predicted DNA-binding protein (MmcQ/YjbR family)